MVQESFRDTIQNDIEYIDYYIILYFLCVGNTGQGFPNPHVWDQKYFWGLEYLHRHSAFLILETGPKCRPEFCYFHMQMVHPAWR